MAYTEGSLLVGTFGDPGMSDHMLLKPKEGMSISLNFGGVGSVTVKGSLDGLFFTPLTKPNGDPAIYTADVIIPLEAASDMFVMLDCTDATADIAYIMTKIASV